MHLPNRLIGIALAALLQFVQVSAQYSVTLPYKQVTVQNVDSIATFSGSQLAGKPGQPALPMYTVTFLLPPDADLASVTTAINGSTEKQLSGQYTVAPMKPITGPDGKVKWPKGAVIVNGKDMGIYGKDAFYVADYKGSTQTGMMQQYKIVDIQIFPYKYNPVTKKLKMITGGTLSVTYNYGSSSLQSSRNADVEKLLKQKVANQSVFDNYGSAPSSQMLLNSAQTYAVASSAAKAAVTTTATSSLAGCTYLIITTNSIVNSTPALTTYRTFLTQKGATVDIATEDRWLSSGSVGQQRCEDIRSMVMSEQAAASRNGKPLKYVLLIGNPDTTNGDVPMKNWNGIKDETEWPNGIPTDYYYSDLSSDWSNGPDAYGEVSVGRIPVYSDVSVVNTYLNKAIAYESASGDATEWRRSYLGLAEIVGFSPESYAQSEDIVATIINKGWNVKRVYNSYAIFATYSNFTLMSPVINMNPLPEYTMMNVGLTQKMWNYEAPGFVYAGGHGFPGGVGNVLQSAPISDYYPENVSQIPSSYPAAVVASSCMTSDPIEPLNCGAAVLYKNAISYCGFSVSVYGPGATVEPYSIAVLANSPFGDAVVAAKTSSGNLEHCLQFNLYGCPEASLNLQTIDTTLTPKNVKVAGPTSVFGLDITWNAVPGAAQYRIERSDTHTGAKIDGFTLIGSTGSGVLKYTDGNISTGTCYKYRVYALNASNQRGAYSQIDSATVFGARSPNLLCSTPSNLAVNSVHSNLVNLSWTASANADYYNVKRSTSASGPFVTVTSPFSTDKTTGTTYADYNVMNGTTYYYVVSAANQYGQSANSSVVSATPVLDLNAPVITSVSDDYNNNVTINWTSDLNTESYNYEWAYKFPDGTYGQYNSFGPIYRFGNTYTFSGVEPVNCQIGFRMRGTADGGTNYSSYSNVYSFYTNNGPIPKQDPTAPTALTTSLATETINLSWSYTEGSPMSIPDNFELYYKIPGGTWSLLNTIAYPTKTWQFTGATPATNYQFCVRAVKVDQSAKINYNSGFSPITSVTTTSALIAPTNLVASVSARGTVDLSWSDNSTARTAYYVEQATSASGPFTQVANSWAGCQITGLSDAKQYWFRVRAYCGSVTSAYSNTATATTISNITTGKTATSGTVQSSNPVANGIDNNTSTRWCASSGSVPQWYKVDLGTNKVISGTEVMWEKSGSNNVYKYIIEYSPDNSNWFLAFDNTTNTSTAQTQAQSFYPVTARYVRITITGVPSGAWASFYEFRVFGYQPPITYEAESSSPSASSVGYNTSTGDNLNSNNAFVQLSGTPATGAWLQFTLANVPAGTYNVTVYYKANNNRAICQGSVDGTNLGGTIDEYSSATVYQKAFSMGSKSFTAGNHTIKFTVTGKNSSSSGYALTVDKIMLTQ